jgi:hypothetical protein
MATQNPLDRPLAQLLEEVQGLQTVAAPGEVRSVMAVVAKCTQELGASLGQVAGGLFDAKRLLADRLTELSTEVRALKTEVATASTQATAQTQALVLWTRVLVGVTALYTLLTGGLLFVALKRLGG